MHKQQDRVKADGFLLDEVSLLQHLRLILNLFNEEQNMSFRFLQIHELDIVQSSYFRNFKTLFVFRSKIHSRNFSGTNQQITVLQSICFWVYHLNHYINPCNPNHRKIRKIINQSSFSDTTCIS